MKTPLLALALTASALLAACGGGGTTTAAPFTPTVTTPNTAPTTAPTTAPSTAPSSVLSTAMIGGSPAFVTSSQLPVYTFGGDTVANQSTCTGGCLQVWPSVAPPAGVALSAPWASFSRADNGASQLTYNGMPLYTFISDSPFTALGDNFENFHLARPASSSTPQPPGGGGPYG